MTAHERLQCMASGALEALGFDVRWEHRNGADVADLSASLHDRLVFVVEVKPPLTARQMPAAIDQAARYAASFDLPCFLLLDDVQDEGPISIGGCVSVGGFRTFISWARSLRPAEVAA